MNKVWLSLFLIMALLLLCGYITYLLQQSLEVIEMQTETISYQSKLIEFQQVRIDQLKQEIASYPHLNRLKIP